MAPKRATTRSMTPPTKRATNAAAAAAAPVAADSPVQLPPAAVSAAAPVETRTERFKYKQPDNIVIQAKCSYVPKTGIARLLEMWAIEVGTVLLPTKTKYTINTIIFLMVCFSCYSTVKGAMLLKDGVVSALQ